MRHRHTGNRCAGLLAGFNGALLEFETVGPSGRHIVSAKNKRSPPSVRLIKRRRFSTSVQDGVHRTLTNSLNFVSWKMQKEVAADLKLIYSATTVDLAEQRLAEFEVKWDKDYQSISLSWRRNWARIIPFFDYPPEIRKVTYTTNAIESINMSLRKVIKTRSSFPTDEAVTKLFYLALKNISKKWTMPIRDWKAALNRFTIQFDERMLPG